MEELFREVLRETKKEPFKNGDPNSQQAWLRIDESDTKDGRIYLEKFEWEQDKSNENVRGKLEDGKGFSFYFARYAYLDPSLLRNSEFSKGGCSGVAASIEIEILMKYLKKSETLSPKVDPDARVLLVIDEDLKGSNTEIISATFMTSGWEFEEYKAYRREMMRDAYAQVYDKKIKKIQEESTLMRKIIEELDEEIEKSLLIGAEILKQMIRKEMI
jgi:hypothetical protein